MEQSVKRQGLIPALKHALTSIGQIKWCYAIPAALLLISLLLCTACSSGGDLNDPLSEVPNKARRALDQRIKADFDTDDYTVVAVQKSASGNSWCIVFEPPLKGSLGGQTLLYDYAAIQPDGNSWNAIMVEDHQGGIVLSVFGCQAVYKEPSE